MKLIRSCTPRLHLTEVGNLPAERLELPTNGLINRLRLRDPNSARDVPVF